MGEDEFGSGIIGIKQALVSAGMIPMVATTRKKMDQDNIKKALDAQGKTYKKKIMLCKFKFEKVVLEVGHTE